MIPKGKCNVLKTKLYDTSNTLTFGSKTAQSEYFASCAVKSYNDFTYIKKDNVIKVPNVLEDVLNANYVMFQNSNFSNKWFYAFITNIEYVSPHCTNIHIVIDAFQTFQFDITFGESFIEREHVSKENDVIGRHTVAENLPLGRIKNTLNYDSTGSQKTGYLIGVKMDLDGKLMTGGGAYKAVFGCGLYATDNIANVPTLCKKLEEVQSGNVIFVNSMDVKALPPHGTDGKCIGILIDTGDPIFWANAYQCMFERPKDIDGYAPKNNKLFTYPFVYCTATFGNTPMTYLFENFDNGIAHFKIGCECSQSPIDISVPVNYEGIALNYDKKVVSEVYPTIPHTTDNTEYYQQAKSFMNTGQNINMDSMAMNSIYSAVVSSTSGVQGMTNAVTQLGGTLINIQYEKERQQLERAKFDDTVNRTVHQFNGNSCASLKFLTNDFGFKYYTTTITAEYAKIIDDFFTKYGYKTLRLKKPNLNNRPNFNFVKTVNANIYGECPVEYINQIKLAFDNGVTLWHNPSTMYDYSNN